MVSTTNPGPPSELWDIDEVADYFGTGKRFIYRLTSEHRIRYMKIGRALRFDPADVAAFLEREKAQNDPAPASPPAPRAGRPRRR
jgi:excisionase family DNA binding protein